MHWLLRWNAFTVLLMLTSCGNSSDLIISKCRSEAIPNGMLTELDSALRVAIIVPPEISNSAIGGGIKSGNSNSESNYEVVQSWVLDNGTKKSFSFSFDGHRNLLVVGSKAYPVTNIDLYVIVLDAAWDFKCFRVTSDSDVLLIPRTTMQTLKDKCLTKFKPLITQNKLLLEIGCFMSQSSRIFGSVPLSTQSCKLIN